MKKTIIILTGSIIAISILWLADKKLLNKTSDPGSAENQKKEESVQQGSSTNQKIKAKSTSKYPVYDLYKKSHWYDPEKTMRIYGVKPIFKMIKLFHPAPKEF